MLHKITDSLSSIHNTVFTGKVLLQHKSLPSTNLYLRQLLQEGPVADGTVVWALEQTAGRGQGNHVWETLPNENLTFSLLYRPAFLPAEGVFILNKMVALAILDTLQNQLPHAAWHIKWPNDIMVNDKKVAGILIETGLRTNVETAIIGIGINVNQRDFPGLPHATSLLLESGERFELDTLLNQLLQHLEAGYLLLRRDAPAAGIHRRFYEHLWGRGEYVQWEANGDTFGATLLGVRTDGKLEIDREGKIECYELGQIKWLR
jgi:BirA family biotin operon repressor/biotin-[acetyl-CoA-carboxylase] ligase